MCLITKKYEKQKTEASNYRSLLFKKALQLAVFVNIIPSPAYKRQEK